MKNTDLDCHKAGVVREIFQDTADETYVVARWCYFNNLMIPFYWNGLHAIEKYLKAVLLLNDQSSIKHVKGTKFSHNIELLYDAVHIVAGEFLPEQLKKPDEFDNRYWHNESIAVFVQRLNNLGDPNNRYNLYGFSQLPEDLYKLDELVYYIRRVAIRLDSYAFVGTHRVNGDSSFSNADLLRKNPTIFGISGRLKELTRSSASSETRFAGLEHNFAFAGVDYEHSNIQHYRSSSHNPVLYRYIIEPAKKAEKPNTLLADLGEWVVSNILLPSDNKKEIQDAVNALRAGRPLQTHSSY